MKQRRIIVLHFDIIYHTRGNRGYIYGYQVWILRSTILIYNVWNRVLMRSWFISVGGSNRSTRWIKYWIMFHRNILYRCLSITLQLCKNFESKQISTSRKLKFRFDIDVTEVGQYNQRSVPWRPLSWRKNGRSFIHFLASAPATYFPRSLNFSDCYSSLWLVWDNQTKFKRYWRFDKWSGHKWK